MLLGRTLKSELDGRILNAIERVDHALKYLLNSPHSNFKIEPFFHSLRACGWGHPGSPMMLLR
jgi:hypothetical protein